MAIQLGSAYGKIVIDSSGVKSGVDSANKSLGSLEQTTQKLSERLKVASDRFEGITLKINETKKAAASLQQISQTMFLAGSALVGGIFLAAKTEAERIKEAGGQIDKTTARWLAANERIEASQHRIGRAAEVAFLPVLERVADLAEKAADFVKKNPELVSAALKIGLWTAGIGALGLAVAKGIRLYADVAYLAATAQFTLDAIAIQAAALTMFEAAVLMQTGEAGGLGKAARSILPLGEKTPAGTAAGAGLTGVAPAIGILIAGAFLVELERKGINKLMGTDTSFGDMALTYTRIFDLPALAVSSGLAAVGLDKASAALVGIVKNADGFIQSILGVGPAVDTVAAALAGLGSIAEDEAKGFKILKDLAEDEAKALRSLADDRETILINATRDIADADRSLEGSLAGIASSLVSNISKIKSKLRDTLADLAAGFAEENIKAASEYQKRQAEIESDGAEEIQKIRKQAQKDLEQLEKSHNRNVYSLTLARDALGLSQENAAYKERKNEIKNNADEAVAQARANTKAQLEEAARNYGEQRTQRLAEYKKQQEEAKAHAVEATAEVKIKAAEDKKAAQEKYAEERAEIERRRVEALADLKRRYDSEQRERVIAAHQAISDLRGALKAELELRRQYYKIFNDELQKALLSAKTNSPLKLPAALTPGSPTPFEMGLRGISAAMDELSKKSFPNLQTSMAYATSPNDISRSLARPVQNMSSSQSNSNVFHLSGGLTLRDVDELMNKKINRFVSEFSRSIGIE